jgi:hypothetical protein
MSTTVIVRGNTVKWTTNFFDFAGAATNPPSASLVVAYQTATGDATTTIAMTGPSGFNWTATWESEAALSGDIDWYIKTPTTPKTAEQGNFSLKANRANLNP